MKLLRPLLLLLTLCLAAASPAPLRLRAGKDFALFFAVRDYQHWQRLPGTVSDANRLAAELQQQYGFEAKVYENKTRTEILAIIGEYKRRSYEADAQLLVFFGGHGYYDGQCTGYFVPRDGLPNDPDGTSYLSFADLQQRIASIPCKHILLMMDACYAGTADLATACPDLFRGYVKPVRPNQPDSRDLFIRQTLAEQSRIYYAAAGNKPTTDRSEFAAQFLDALQNHYDSKGILTMDDLKDQLQYAQPRPVFGEFIGNRDAEAFLFVRNLTPAPPPATTDRDGDGVPNATDACPDTYGTAANNGCPDKLPTSAADLDGDGIPNATDACPDQFGTAKARGCPDADDDGVPDQSDKCRYLAGETRWEGCPATDGDGLPDHQDECPDQKGSAADKGCPAPDRDGDGVPDRADRCPDAAGRANFQGCPDTDADGIPDPDDKCPREKGSALKDGCPDVSRPSNMVLVSGGTFTMGCKDGRDTDCYGDEKPAHSVTVRDFYIGRYEVTNAEYCQFLNEKGNQKEGGETWVDLSCCKIEQSGSRFTVKSGYENHPVVCVSWYGAVAYCAWLSQKTGQAYRLPTEAEWEYAARGGNKTRNYLYAGSNTLDEVAWYSSNSGSQTHAVGTKKANELDLFDFSGNVWEWCADDWHDNYQGAPTNGSAWIDSPNRGGYRVFRGGGWDSTPRNCRAAIRLFNGPTNRLSLVGFRLALQY
ncbi:MAG: SUMF1/EgtB/PvdO family nonheme iron enzyme [Saprospiraceae bacterium]|nr:SUMF1/EgtB/PvdO family nonheme iron enzyme [Saprospiraceae bacterium]